MTRGRKKDLTIPPSRSLTQQRDYRARKAHYISQLEAHCRKVDQENEELRRELAETKARLANPVVVHPETEQASHELLYSLAMASVSLTKFQQLAFPNAQQPTLSPTLSHEKLAKISDSQSSLPVIPHTRDTIQPESQSQSQVRAGRKRLFTESDDERSHSRSKRVTDTSPITVSSRSESSEEPCCGGYIDCDAICDDGILEEGENTGNITRMSGMRSTFGYKADIS